MNDIAFARMTNGRRDALRSTSLNNSNGGSSILEMIRSGRPITGAMDRGDGFIVDLTLNGRQAAAAATQNTGIIGVDTLGNRTGSMDRGDGVIVELTLNGRQVAARQAMVDIIGVDTLGNLTEGQLDRLDGLIVELTLGGRTQ